MQRTTAKDYALLILRLAGLYLALAHGWGKVFALLTGHGAGWVQGVASLGFPAPIVFAWASALAEFAGGLCVAFGFGTRVFAFFAGFNLLVAAFVRHRAFTRLLAWLGVSGTGAEALRSLGNPEQALLYLMIFSALVVLGGGRVSVEAWLRQRRR